MITKNDKETVEKIIKFIDKHSVIDELQIDWDMIHWIDVLRRIVSSLEKAPESYRECSEEDIKNHFFTAECSNCGWWGSSKLLDGGGAIADSGDHFDVTCPVCSCPEIDEK